MWIDSLYHWAKALHLIFMVAWMASMLVYPRYRLHQLNSTPGEPLFEAMKDASARLKRIIMTPSMLIVWAAGLTMLALPEGRTWLSGQGWMHVKLVFVLAMSGVHGYLIALGRKVDAGTATISTKQLKLLNELPFLILILIVLLAVLKPF